MNIKKVTTDKINYSSVFSVNMRLPEIGEVGQRLLRDARVAIVGCGGLGAPVAQNLMCAGVGHLSLFDDDRVEASNLNRQWWFRYDDIGRYKADCAVEFLEKYRLCRELQAFVTRIQPENAANLLSQYDIIIDASDNFQTKYILNDVACSLQKTLVHGAASGWDAQVMLIGTSSACLRCLFPVIPPRAQQHRCDRVGVLSSSLSIVAGVMSHLAVLAMCGHTAEALNTYYRFDLRQPHITRLHVQREEQCLSCGRKASIYGDNPADYVSE